MIQIHSQDI